jgi:hypothetical protein
MGHVGWAAVSFLALPWIHATGHTLSQVKGGFLASQAATLSQTTA